MSADSRRLLSTHRRGSCLLTSKSRLESLRFSWCCRVIQMYLFCLLEHWQYLKVKGRVSGHNRLFWRASMMGQPRPCESLPAQSIRIGIHELQRTVDKLPRDLSWTCVKRHHVL